MSVLVYRWIWFFSIRIYNQILDRIIFYYWSLQWYQNICNLKGVYERNIEEITLTHLTRLSSFLEIQCVDQLPFNPIFKVNTGWENFLLNVISSFFFYSNCFVVVFASYFLILYLIFFLFVHQLSVLEW